jgi:hypothetical protein
MNVRELNRDQLSELKQRFLFAEADEGLREWPSWGELANADALVTDEQVYEAWDGTEFVEEDFSC